MSNAPKGSPPEAYDYVYLGGKNAGAPGDPHVWELLLAYERPEINGGEGTHVLFADAHVQWLPMAEFKKALERTQAYLKKQEKGQ